MSAEPKRVAVDGTVPPGPDLVRALAAACDAAETGGAPVVVEVSGLPGPDWADLLDIGLVTKWERTLRRLEHLLAVTIATATGDCGGPALDVLLATDLRVATPGTRLHVVRSGGDTWPGTAIYRLVQQAGAGPVRSAVLFGEPIDIDRALDLGLIHGLVATPGAVPAEIADRAAGESGRELAIRRRLLLDAATTGFEEALGAHLAASDRSLRRQAS